MRSLLLMAMLLAAGAGPVLALEVGETIDVKGWKIGRSQETDKSQTCELASTATDKKGALGFSANPKDGTAIVLVDSELTMKAGDKYSAEYQVDKRDAVTVKGVVAGTTAYVLSLGSWKEAQGFLDTLSAGNSIAIEVGGFTYTYDLTGSKAAILEFDECAKAIGLPR